MEKLERNVDWYKNMSDEQIITSCLKSEEVEMQKTKAKEKIISFLNDFEVPDDYNEINKKYRDAYHNSETEVYPDSFGSFVVKVDKVEHRLVFMWEKGKDEHTLVFPDNPKLVDLVRAGKETLLKEQKLSYSSGDDEFFVKLQDVPLDNNLAEKISRYYAIYPDDESFWAQYTEDKGKS